MDQFKQRLLISLILIPGFLLGMNLLLSTRQDSTADSASNPSPTTHQNINLVSLTAQAIDLVTTYPTTDQIRHNLQQEDIEQYLSQLLMISIPGTSLTVEDQELFRQIQPGGVILMSPNIKSREQIRILVEQLQSLSDIPLIIAIDQEGGAVSRLTWDTGPGLYSLRISSQTEVCQTAQERGQLLAELGINLNLAPVADLSSGPGDFIEYRSFGSDAQEVSRKTETYIHCQQAAGIATTAKHFPGHHTDKDSHHTIPTIDTPYDSWIREDALPFKAAINANTSAILVGHLIYTDLDSHNPASLSADVISVLSDGLGFDGLIITDDLNMLRTSTQLSDKKILIKATGAGNHLLMNIQTSLQKQLQFKKLLSRVAASGQLNSDQLHATIVHILRNKQSLIPN